MVRTSNGGLDINDARDVSVTAETSNAPLTFSGSLAPGSHSLATINGNLTLTLPGDAAFTIDGSDLQRQRAHRLPAPRSSTDTTVRGTTGVSSA